MSGQHCENIDIKRETIHCYPRNVHRWLTSFVNKVIICFPPVLLYNKSPGSRVGAVVRALDFHQCVPGSIPGPGVICGLSFLVLYSAPRGFSPGTPVFPSPQKPTFDLI